MNSNLNLILGTSVSAAYVDSQHIQNMHSHTHALTHPNLNPNTRSPTHSRTHAHVNGKTEMEASNLIVPQSNASLTGNRGSGGDQGQHKNEPL